MTRSESGGGNPRDRADLPESRDSANAAQRGDASRPEVTPTLQNAEPRRKQPDNASGNDALSDVGEQVQTLSKAERTELLNRTVEAQITLARGTDPAGKAQAWKSLYALYSRPVFRLVWRTLDRFASREETEDVTSDVFTNAIKVFHQFSGLSRGEFEGWLFTSARNAAFRRREKLAKAQEMFEDGLTGILSGDPRTIANDISPGHSEGVHPNMIVADFQEKSVHELHISDAIAALLRAFPTLSPRQQQCIAGVHQGYTQEEIAEILGISSSSVAYYVSQGYRRLREAIRGVYLT